MNNDHRNENNNSSWERNGQNNTNDPRNGQYYDPNNQYYNPNGQYYNPNEQYYNPNGQQYGPNGGPNQFRPDNFFHPPVQSDDNGRTAQTFGIIALVGLFFCTILSIIFGALALSKAKLSRTALGYECSEAKTGRITGMIGLIVGIVNIVAAVFIYAIVIAAVL